MTSPPTSPRELAGATVSIEVLQGRGLIAKDRNLFGKRTTSDPYCVVSFGNKTFRTKTIAGSLSPVWNELFSVTLGAQEAHEALSGGHQDTVTLQLYDHDARSSDDPMGVVHISLSQVLHNHNNNGQHGEPQWYPVQKGREGTPNYCRNAQGELQVQIKLQATEFWDIRRGQEYTLGPRCHKLVAGLRWDVEYGQKVDMDSSCVAVDNRGNIVLDESVYYGNLFNPNRSLMHSGDEKTGEKQGDDETITVNLDHIPQRIVALYFVLTVAHPPHTLCQVKSAAVHFTNADTGVGLCRFAPAELADNHTALFLLRLSRSPTASNAWTLTPISEGNAYARDFGALVPQLKSYTQDLVPGLVVNPDERMAILRKGGVIRIADYLPRGSPPVEQLTLGLSWDVTNGRPIDLDASAFMLDKNHQVVDLVSYRQLRSKDGSIQHSGDEREGDEVGDDEKIQIDLSRVSPNVQYIGFVINSFSGQELDDVSKASCHLFDPKTKSEVALYSMAANREVDKHTALLMGALYRDESNSNTWDFYIISEPSDGRVADDCLFHLQNFLESHPPSSHMPAELPEPEIVLGPDDISMPASEPVDEEIVVIPEDELEQVLHPPSRTSY